MAQVGCYKTAKGRAGKISRSAYLKPLHHHLELSERLRTCGNVAVNTQLNDTARRNFVG